MKISVEQLRKIIIEQAGIEQQALAVGAAEEKKSEEMKKLKTQAIAQFQNILAQYQSTEEITALFAAINNVSKDVIAKRGAPPE
jgi:mitochondrial fission protein ELM1